MSSFAAPLLELALKRLLTFLFLITTLCGAWALPPNCDSCRVEVRHLEQPISLTGNWLFTRDDAAANKDPGADLSHWVVAKAPGPWKKAYGDGKNFHIGWYRAHLHFDPSLVGTEVVLLVNTYMARMEVFVDGQSVYKRPDDANLQRYYSIQPVPVRFKISRPEQVLTMRVDTPLMTGVYQLPLEIRTYDPKDLSLVAYKAWGGELRLVVGCVIAFFGLFFLLVYAKTRYGLYLTAALCSLIFFPFFAAPSDILLGAFDPEKMLYLHYIGLIAIFCFYPFCQYLDRFHPRVNWALGGTITVCGLVIGSMAVHANLNLFQSVRTVLFLANVLTGVCCLHALWHGMKNGKPNARILFATMVLFIGCGVHDVLLALGAIKSVSLMFVGASSFVAAMLYAASNTFADTFMQNKRLVRDLQGMNDNLEGLVAERTLQLRQKTHDIQSMLQNMPQGVLTIQPDNTVHPEYSAYLETILETSDVAGRDVMQLLFSGAKLGADVLDQVGVASAACIGEDRMNFEFNSHLLPAEFDKQMPDGRIKSLALSWSPICDENDTIEKLMLCVRDVTELKRLSAEANQQRRELEIIGQVLAISQEKFHEFITSGRGFLARNRELLQNMPARTDAVLNELFRNMHTLKGNARTFGLLQLANVVHSAEQAYDDLRKDNGAAWDTQSLLDDLSQVQAALEEYARVNDHTLGRKGPGRRGSVERFLMVDKAQVAASLQLIRSVNPADTEQLRHTLHEVGQTLSLIGTDTAANLLAGTIGSLPSLAVELGKEPPQVQVEDHGIRVRTQLGGVLRNTFTHVLRNAVDHGLETAAERIARGKPAIGRITLELGLTPQHLTIAVHDDGRGLNVRAIRSKALERGLLPADAPARDEDVAQLIFLSGFSTAQKLTEVSGRGVGMDAVKDFVRAEGGDVQIHFLDDAEGADFRRFELVVELPARFAVRASTSQDLHDLPEFNLTMPGSLQPA